jgi:hypothetical protein
VALVKAVSRHPAAGLHSVLSCTVPLILKALREETGSAASGVRRPPTASPSVGALSGAARNVSLYRAVEFPHRWTREACLVEGIECYDATLLEETDD